MQEVLNTSNSINLIDFSARNKSSAGFNKRDSFVLKKRSTMSSSKDSMQREEQVLKTREEFQTKTRERTKEKPEAEASTSDRPDRVLEKKDDSKVNSKDDNNNNETESVDNKDKFERTLEKKTDNGTEAKQDYIEKMSPEELEEAVIELIQALISMVQELSESNDKPVSIDIDIDLNIDIDVDVQLQSNNTNPDYNATIDINTIDINKTINIDAEMVSDMDSGKAISELLHQFAEEINLEGASQESSQLLDIVNKLLNSEALSELDLSEKITFAQEVNELFNNKIEEIKAKVDELIKNIDLNDLSDISLNNVDLDNDYDLEVNEDLQKKLERIINLGDKSESLEKHQRMSEKLANALERLDKQVTNTNLDQVKLPETAKEKILSLLDTKLEKLLNKFDAEIINDSISNTSTETSLSIGLDSLSLEDLSSGSDTRGNEQQNSNQNQNPVNIISRNIKTALNKNVTISNPVNTRMKAQEFIKHIPDMVRNTPANSSKQLTIRLNPEELGTVDVRITKNANQQLSIELRVTNDVADKVLRQKITELTASLADKGVSIEDINISKADPQSMKQDQNPDGQNPNSFNEASEEQKKQQEENTRRQNEEERQNNVNFQNELMGILNNK